MTLQRITLEGSRGQATTHSNVMERAKPYPSPRCVALTNIVDSYLIDELSRVEPCRVCNCVGGRYNNSKSLALNRSLMTNSHKNSTFGPRYLCGPCPRPSRGSRAIRLPLGSKVLHLVLRRWQPTI
jgi:hypothetical protein